MRSGRGTIRIFRFSGIDVFLHWSWFLVVVYEIQRSKAGGYSSVSWNIVECLTIFVIVTVHEFGHALACRQVGGTVNRIVLWPLGGIAYVDPPPRPGATLWSLAAGPLVNVVLVPILGFLAVLSNSPLLAQGRPNTTELIPSIFWINCGLLLFNILPVYPLDGGQILRSLLWFVLGRARSLMAAAVIGFLGVAGFIVLAVRVGDAWLGIIAIYLAMSCWSGFKQAQALSRLAQLPRRQGFSCPTCHNPPPVGNYWKCGKCGQPFDTFASSATCPNCRTQYQTTRCLDCGRTHPMHDWMSSAYAAPNMGTTIKV